MKIKELQDLPEEYRNRVILIVKNVKVCEALKTLMDNIFDVRLIVYNHIYSADGTDIVMNYLKNIFIENKNKVNKMKSDQTIESLNYLKISIESRLEVFKQGSVKYKPEAITAYRDVIGTINAMIENLIKNSDFIITSQLNERVKE